jgi:hypothetical protein
VHIALWGCEIWALKEADRSKLEAFHHGCLRRMCGWMMWDVADKRIKNEQVRRTVANSPTMDSMMEMRRCRWLSELSAMKTLISPRRILGAWCPTPRPAGRPQHTIRRILKKLGFEEEKEGLMARSMGTVESSRLIHESPQACNERQMTIDTNWLGP